MLYAFFCVIRRRFNFICRRFGTFYPPMKMQQCSETSVYKIQTPANYAEERIQQDTKKLHSRFSQFWRNAPMESLAMTFFPT